MKEFFELVKPYTKVYLCSTNMGAQCIDMNSCSSLSRYLVYVQSEALKGHTYYLLFPDLDPYQEQGV